jgi:hypothetical protein
MTNCHGPTDRASQKMTRSWQDAQASNGTYTQPMFTAEAGAAEAVKRALDPLPDWRFTPELTSAFTPILIEPFTTELTPRLTIEPFDLTVGDIEVDLDTGTPTPRIRANRKVLSFLRHEHERASVFAFIENQHLYIAGDKTEFLSARDSSVSQPELEWDDDRPYLGRAAYLSPVRSLFADVAHAVFGWTRALVRAERRALDPFVVCIKHHARSAAFGETPTTAGLTPLMSNLTRTAPPAVA